MLINILTGGLDAYILQDEKAAKNMFGKFIRAETFRDQRQPQVKTKDDGTQSRPESR